MVDCDGWHCRKSTQRDDTSNGAHTMQGSTDGWSCSGKWVIILFSCFLLYLNCTVVCTPHAIAVDMYIWIRWKNVCYKNSPADKKSRFWKIYSWYKAWTLYEDNEYWLICNFVERLMVDCDWMTLQTEHTKGWQCKCSTQHARIQWRMKLQWWVSLN